MPTGTSLAIASGVGAGPDRAAGDACCGRCVRRTTPGRSGGDAATAHLRTSYAAACVTVGRDVRVELPGGAVLTGRAMGVDPGGRLIVAGPGGETAVGAGDVVHVRATDR